MKKEDKTFETLKSLIPAEIVMQAKVYRNPKAIEDMVMVTLNKVKEKLPTVRLSENVFKKYEIELQEIVMCRILVY